MANFISSLVFLQLKKKPFCQKKIWTIPKATWSHSIKKLQRLMSKLIMDLQKTEKK